MLSASSADFPHKWAVMFLIAVGFWNFLGAGVFGFLINMPMVSYYEIGTQLTANHAHGAMMGVYGMLAMGFFMFVARYFIPPDRNSERAMKISFWSLNIGLLVMVIVNLFPIGALQLYDAFHNGYWHSREPAFFQDPLVRAMEWLRLPGRYAVHHGRHSARGLSGHPHVPGTGALCSTAGRRRGGAVSPKCSNHAET